MFMVTKHFHVEHADGRRWTDEELWELFGDEINEDHNFLVTMDGCLFVADICGDGVFSIDSDDDMVVVWDE